MGNCPNSELIARYAAGRCSEDEQRGLIEHIEQCASCRQQLHGARANEGDVTHVIAQDRPDPTEPTRQGDLPTRSMPQISKTPGSSGQADLTADVTFEGYQILDELPAGGQAVVYKAIHKATKSKVALKVLLPGLAGSAKARRYFRQEVELAASLNHPNIVAIRDSGVSHGQYYFSMEYVHGRPLDRYVQAKPMPFREKVILFSKICDAMSHAHQRGVIHRDLKPTNILVDDRGDPHVLDFGLAKTAASLTAVSESTIMPSITGQIKGTVAYMSPEQAAGRPDAVDVRTDVYSLGVILYQMFTGRFPYDVTGSAVSALETIQYTEPVRPRQIVSRFDSDMEAIILKCLAKDPQQRYPSAAALRDEINRWLDGLPIVAKSVSSIYLLRKIVARHRYTASVAALLLVIIAAFSFTSLYLYGSTKRALERAQAGEADLTRLATRNLALNRKLTFMAFLDAWRKNDLSEANTIAMVLADDSMEKKGAAFLLNPESPSQDVTAFRRQFPANAQWFADFVIGEYHLKSGQDALARQAFVRSHRVVSTPAVQRQSLFDRLLTEYVKARLFELGLDRNQPDRPTDVPQGGTQP